MLFIFYHIFPDFASPCGKNRARGCLPDAFSGNTREETNQRNGVFHANGQRSATAGRCGANKQQPLVRRGFFRGAARRPTHQGRRKRYASGSKPHSAGERARRRPHPAPPAPPRRLVLHRGRHRGRRRAFAPVFADSYLTKTEFCGKIAMESGGASFCARAAGASVEQPIRTICGPHPLQRAELHGGERSIFRMFGKTLERGLFQTHPAPRGRGYAASSGEKVKISGYRNSPLRQAPASPATSLSACRFSQGRGEVTDMRKPHP